MRAEKSRVYHPPEWEEPVKPSEESIVELVKDARDLIVQLFRKESRLFMAEVENDGRRYLNELKKMVAAYTFMVGAGLAFLATLLTGSYAFLVGVIQVDPFISIWLGPLLVGALLGIVGYLLFQNAKNDIQEIKPTSRKTVENLKEDINALQPSS